MFPPKIKNKETLATSVKFCTANSSHGNYWHEKDVKGTQNGNEEVKLCLFTGNMILCMIMYI